MSDRLRTVGEELLCLQFPNYSADTQYTPKEQFGRKNRKPGKKQKQKKVNRKWLVVCSGDGI